MIVLKFGGTSVGSPEAISRTIGIISSKLEDNPLVVVSACSGVTDMLYHVCDLACCGSDGVSGGLSGGVSGGVSGGLSQKCREAVEAVRTKHYGIASELGLPSSDPVYSTIDSICEKILSCADEIAGDWAATTAPDGRILLSPSASSAKAALVGQGEMLSSNIICAVMKARGIDIEWFYAPSVMKTTGAPLCGEPDMASISALAVSELRPVLRSHSLVITQGFVGSASDGGASILGRGGSDYSASIFGAALEADRVEIWTDVDGVRSADPRIVSDTVGISKISYEEAAELARFGAKVLHPLTMEPAQEKNIPLYVLNSMNPSAEGTAVMSRNFISDGVKSISYKENIKVINIYSLKMINAAGFMQRVFTVFGERGVSLDLLSSSEASITVTVDNNQNLDGVIEDLSSFALCQVDRDKSQVSIIGKNIISIPGALTSIFGALEGVRLYMIAQGASFLNFSIVVDRPEMKSVIAKLHKTLFP